MVAGGASSTSEGESTYSASAADMATWPPTSLRRAELSLPANKAINIAVRNGGVRAEHCGIEVGHRYGRSAKEALAPHPKNVVRRLADEKSAHWHH